MLFLVEVNMRSFSLRGSNKKTVSSCSILGEWSCICHFLWDPMHIGWYCVLSHCRLWGNCLVHYQSSASTSLVWNWLVQSIFSWNQCHLTSVLAIEQVPTIFFSTTLSNFNQSKWHTSEFSKWVNELLGKWETVPSLSINSFSGNKSCGAE